MIKPSRSKDESGWHSLDILSTLDIDRNPSWSITHSKERYRFLLMMWEMLQLPCLLVLIGLSAGMVALFLKNAKNQIDLRNLLISENDPSWSNYIIYNCYCTTCLLLSSMICEIVCPVAAGGGPSEMKAILSGFVKDELLSSRLIIAKFVGLFLALCGGLSAGREGPMIHITCALGKLCCCCCSDYYIVILL